MTPTLQCFCTRFCAAAAPLPLAAAACRLSCCHHCYWCRAAACCYCRCRCCCCGGGGGGVWCCWPLLGAFISVHYSKICVTRPPYSPLLLEPAHCSCPSTIGNIPPPCAVEAAATATATFSASTTYWAVAAGAGDGAVVFVVTDATAATTAEASVASSYSRVGSDAPSLQDSASGSGRSLTASSNTCTSSSDSSSVPVHRIVIADDGEKTRRAAAAAATAPPPKELSALSASEAATYLPQVALHVLQTQPGAHVVVPKSFKALKDALRAKVTPPTFRIVLFALLTRHVVCSGLHQGRGRQNSESSLTACATQPKRRRAVYPDGGSPGC
jgi:hypothetical protein